MGEAFEVLGIIAAWIAAVVLINLLGSLFNKVGSKLFGSTRSAYASSGGLELRLSVEQEAVDDQTFRVIGVSLRGQLSSATGTTSGFLASSTPWEVTPIVDVRDVTTQPAKAVRSRVREFGRNTRDSLSIEMSPHTVPYATATIPEWLTLCKIPIDILEFPESGARKVCVRVHMKGGEPPVFNDAFLESASRNVVSSTIILDVDEGGYEELARDRRRVEELTVELAMAVSSADGSLDEAEGDVVRHYIASIAASAPGGEAQETKARLNTAVRRGADALRSGRVPEICRELERLATKEQAQGALELALDVAGVDEVAGSEELRVLKMIASELKFDPQLYLKLQHKLLPIQFHEEQRPETLLGIHEGMSAEEVRQVLDREFRKWNGRTSHRDPKIRQQAHAMIELISRVRLERFR